MSEVRKRRRKKKKRRNNGRKAGRKSKRRKSGSRTEGTRHIGIRRQRTKKKVLNSGTVDDYGVIAVVFGPLGCNVDKSISGLPRQLV